MSVLRGVSVAVLAFVVVLAVGALSGSPFLAALASGVIAGLVAVWADRARRHSERERERAAFLGEAATVLLSCRGRDATVRAAASLAVPALADWCAIDLAEGDGSVRRAAVRHADAQLEDLVRQLGERGDPFAAGAADVLGGARLQLWPEVPPSLLAAAARDDKHQRELEALGAGSAIFVPLRTLHGVLGVMTLVAREPRHFGADDVELCEDVARRIAVAIANAEPAAAAADADAAPGRFRRG